MKDYQDGITLPPIGRRVEIGANTLGVSRLLKELFASKNEKTIFSFSGEGYSNKSEQEILLGLNDAGARVIYEEYRHPNTSYVLSWQGDGVSYLDLYVNKSETANDVYVDVHLISNSRKTYELAKEYFKDLEIVKKDNAGFVFSILRNGDGSLHLGRLGLAGVPLERDNYSEKVLTKYDLAVEDLKSNTPSGRVVILEGKPGSGKTYLTRGLFMDIDNAMFVIVPASNVAALGGPELLPLLIKQREAYGSRGPTILVLEDADQCLIPRGTDNMSAISSLLNLGDGILGSLLDVRVIATTNAKQDEMDEAILRDGRLSQRIEVGPLDFDKANEVFQRLIGSKNKQLPPIEGRSAMYPREKMEYTLGKIYKIARSNGWTPPESKDRSSSAKEMVSKPTIWHEESID